MTRGIPVVLLLLTMVVFVGGAARRASSAPTTRATLRVATFNIHKGAGRRAPYDLERTIDAIHRLGADLVGVQEAMRNDPEFGCHDQPALIADGLRRRSGLPWTQVHARAWVTENEQCLDQGRGDAAATEDLAFFSREGILDSKVVRLNVGRVGLAVRLVRLPDTPVVVTHLAANRQNQTDRAREIGLLLPWAKGIGAGVLIGDLNAEAEASELSPLFTHFRDAWPEAAAQGTARGVANGGTRPNRASRIDYVLYAPEGGLTLEAVEVIDPVTIGLADVSDHNPVVAQFRLASSR